MAIFDLFRKKAPEVEKKSYSEQGYPPFAFAEYLGANANGDLRALEAVRLYKRCTPLYQAVNMRAEAFSSIQPRVWDEANKEWVDDHPVLDLLKNPNPAQSNAYFMKSVSSFADIAGEFFVIAAGNKGSEPLELYAAKPQNITITESQRPGDYGAAGRISWQSNVAGEIYTLDREFGGEIGGSFRYWNREENREIWQAKDFNPSNDSLRGLPKAAPLWLQIQQFIEADTNNYSVLKRGARPSVVWVWSGEGEMTDEQFQRWKEQATGYEGAINAGKQVLGENIKPEVVSISNKDMEFAQNRKVVREDIFSAYQIPLSLVSSETMTMDNLKTGTLLFWDGSVLPHADNIYNELTRLLMPRYDNSENLRITYNPIDIEALKERAIARALDMQKTKAVKDDELRAIMGLDEYEGGDVVYKPISDQPAGTQPGGMGSESVQMGLDSFRRHMKTILKTDGSRAFSDVEIELEAESQGLK